MKENTFYQVMALVGFVWIFTIIAVSMYRRSREQEVLEPKKKKPIMPITITVKVILPGKELFDLPDGKLPDFEPCKYTSQVIDGKLASPAKDREGKQELFKDAKEWEKSARLALRENPMIIDKDGSLKRLLELEIESGRLVPVKKEGEK